MGARVGSTGSTGETARRARCFNGEGRLSLALGDGADAVASRDDGALVSLSE
jgi:hypothetical protein